MQVQRERGRDSPQGCSKCFLKMQESPAILRAWYGCRVDGDRGMAPPWWCRKSVFWEDKESIGILRAWHGCGVDAERGMASPQGYGKSLSWNCRCLLPSWEPDTDPVGELPLSLLSTHQTPENCTQKPVWPTTFSASSRSVSVWKASALAQKNPKPYHSLSAPHRKKRIHTHWNLRFLVP